MLFAAAKPHKCGGRLLRVSVSFAFSIKRQKWPFWGRFTKIAPVAQLGEADRKSDSMSLFPAERQARDGLAGVSLNL